MKTKRKNITQPEDWWTAFETAAKRNKTTLSQWVGECCASHLPATARRGLSERVAANRPKKRDD